MNITLKQLKTEKTLTVACGSDLSWVMEHRLVIRGTPYPECSRHVKNMTSDFITTLFSYRAHHEHMGSSPFLYKWCAISTLSGRSTFGTDLFIPIRDALIECGIVLPMNNTATGKPTWCSEEGLSYCRAYRLEDNYYDAHNFTLTSVYDRLSATMRRRYKQECVERGGLYDTKCVILDMSGALQALETLGIERKWSYMVRLMMRDQLESFNFKGSDSKVSPNVGRMFNKINQMPSVLRNFIVMDGVTSTEIDIKSSSMTFIIDLMTDGDEKKRLSTHIENGTGYEQFGLTRKAAKKAWMLYLGGVTEGLVDSKIKFEHTHIGKMIDYMSSEYPILHEHILDIGSKAHIMYQRAESKIITEMVDEFKLISIHDGLLVPLAEAQHLREVLVGKIRLSLGVTPIVTVG